MGKAYWFAPRPPEVSHRHPFLVFDCQDQLHFELTVFGKEAAARVERKTVEGYLRALLPFLPTWKQMNGKCALLRTGKAIQRASATQSKTS